MLARSFGYDELPNGAMHRLMRLSPVQNSQHMVCELKTTYLPVGVNVPIPYQALSYCWGSENRDLKIILRSVPSGTEGLVGVTENLYSFLLTMLDMSFFDWLFIDAVCINQENLGERAQQVRIMSEIYRFASRVTVWLGDDEEGQKFLNWAQTWKTLSPLDRFELGRVRMGEALKKDKNLVEGFAYISSNVYWTRLWIVPEFRLGQAVEIQCGKSTLSWQALWYFWRNCSFTLPEMAQMQGGLMSNLLVQKSTVPSGEPHTLIELIGAFAAQRCTDSRDKIYAILPLVPEGKAFPIDYGIPVEELFLTAWLQMDCARKMLSTYDLERALDVQTPAVVMYASQLANGKDSSPPVECDFIRPWQSPACTCGFQYDFGIEFRNGKYAICCFSPGLPPGMHILFESDEQGHGILDQEWMAVGLLEGNGRCSDLPATDIASYANVTLPQFSLKTVTAQPLNDLTHPRENEEKTIRNSRVGRAKLRITKFGLAVLIHNAREANLKMVM